MEDWGQTIEWSFWIPSSLLLAIPHGRLQPGFTDFQLLVVLAGGNRCWEPKKRAQEPIKGLRFLDIIVTYVLEIKEKLTTGAKEKIQQIQHWHLKTHSVLCTTNSLGVFQGVFSTVQRQENVLSSARCASLHKKHSFLSSVESLQRLEGSRYDLPTRGILFSELAKMY